MKMTPKPPIAPKPFVNIKGETIIAPPGCDGLCRLDCEAYDPQHVYCQEQGADCEERREDK